MRDQHNDTLEKQDLKGLLSEFLQKYGVIASIGILIVVFSLTTEVFFTAENFLHILRAVSILAIVSLGLTFAVAVDGFDVSVGAVTGLAVILAPALMVIWQVPWYLAILICWAAGIIIGLVNTFLIEKVRIPDLLATLGMLFLVSGLQMAITGGNAVYRGMFHPWNPGQLTEGVMCSTFLTFGQGHIFGSPDFGGIPISVLIMISIALVAFVLLEFTRYGRNIYAVGSNREAARLAGINVLSYRAVAYIISAFLATTGGMLLAARIASGPVGAGDPYLLDSVAAVFFGFAVLKAWRPNVLGTLTGAIFMGIMLNGLTMLGVPWYIQDILKGLVLIFAIGFSFYMKRQA
ncbi:ABC transporter permease [Dehalococcoidia bacterium]|nr:ABC transporter permease [Dehalococcoidia bacterium]